MTRDTFTAAAEGKSAQIALATKGFLDSQTGLALLICRARDVARTTRHARHDHGTGTVQRRNVLIFRSGNLRFTPPTSDNTNGVGGVGRVVFDL